MINVSIIVPCYKVEAFLDRCMNSLLNQTMRNIEIILVDDGSPDICPQLCEDYANKDSRVRVIHKKNQGLGLARNSGLEIAKGEYVAFVDSDDFVSTNMYESMYMEAKEHHVDAVFCNFFTEQPNGTWHNSGEVKVNTNWSGNMVRKFMLDMIASPPHISSERLYQMSVWHAIYKRSIILKYDLKFLSERVVGSEDIPFQIDFLKNANSIAYIQNPFYYYCYNGKSLTTNYKMDMFERYKNLYRILREKTAEIPGALVRVNRFFIGYSRYCIRHIAVLDKQEGKVTLEELLGDEIWIQVNRKFKPSYLPVKQRIFYWLTLHKCKKGLVLLCNLINLLNKQVK